MNVTIAQAKKIVKLGMRARQPVLLGGAPGIGKTDIVMQAAAEEGQDILVSHPVTADVTDAKGLPFRSEDGKTAVFLPYGDLAQAMAATRPMTWFLDDFGQATTAVQGSYMQLLLARRVGEHRIPDCVTFMAATNRRKDNGGVSGLLEPVKSRFATIIDDILVDVDSWIAWALEHNMPGELIAFLQFRSDLLHKPNPSKELKNAPAPRTWAKLGTLMHAGIDSDIEEAVFQGAVGEEAANEFLTFLRLWGSLPNPESIILDPDSARVDYALDVQYLLAKALAGLATKDNFGRILRYGERMLEAGRAEIATLMVRLCTRENPKVTQTAAYAEALTGPLGKQFA